MKRTIAWLGYCGLFLVACAHYPLSHDGTWNSVPSIVVVAQEDDPRLPDFREAVDFWNRTFAELDTPFRLGSITRITTRIPEEFLSKLSTSAVEGTPGPDTPQAVREMAGDIIVVLADADFVSFSRRLRSEQKVLVGIRSHRLFPLTLPNVTRNLIAHELGHAIGLGHNADPTKLMCGRPAPCRPDAFRSTEKKVFPLTTAEKAQLVKMYPVSWRSRRWRTRASGELSSDVPSRGESSEQGVARSGEYASYLVSAKAEDCLAHEAHTLRKAVTELDRETKRLLLGAYQAGLIELAQLGWRQGFLCQRRAHVEDGLAVLRGERATAQQQAQSHNSPEAFVGSVRGSLVRLWFADRQRRARSTYNLRSLSPIHWRSSDLNGRSRCPHLLAYVPIIEKLAA